jgi:hypothetical protein
LIRRLVPLAFALALLAFALPFATVSCDAARVEASGADLVLRTPPETEGRAPEGIELGELVVAAGGGLATAAFLAFALGLLASARKWGSGWAPFAGVVGVAALVFLKTRGGPENIAEVDARIGAFLAAGAGAAAALGAGAVWLRGARPPLRPLAPVIAAGLVLFGYLFPSERSPLVVVAYADTLNLRRPWDGVSGCWRSWWASSCLRDGTGFPGTLRGSPSGFWRSRRRTLQTRSGASFGRTTSSPDSRRRHSLPGS